MWWIYNTSGVHLTQRERQKHSVCDYSAWKRPSLQDHWLRRCLFLNISSLTRRGSMTVKSRVDTFSFLSLGLNVPFSTAGYQFSFCLSLDITGHLRETLCMCVCRRAFWWLCLRCIAGNTVRYFKRCRWRVDGKHCYYGVHVCVCKRLTSKTMLTP